MHYATLWAGPYDGLRMALPPHDPHARPDLPITQEINGHRVTIGTYEWSTTLKRYEWKASQPTGLSGM